MDKDLHIAGSDVIRARVSEDGVVKEETIWKRSDFMRLVTDSKLRSEIIVLQDKLFEKAK